MESIKIVFICDEKFAMPLCVALTSLKKNKRLNTIYNIYILYDKLNIYSQDQILKLNGDDFSIAFVRATCMNWLDNINTEAILGKDISANKVAMAKFFISDIFDNIDKILYLDSDILVLKDLSDLYQKDVGDYYAAVVPELDIGEFDYMERLGIRNRHYFNSGVMLLNLKKMRQESISAKLMNYRVNGLNYYMDQDTFNVIFGDQVLYLGYEYNCLNKHYEQLLFERENYLKRERYSEVNILHFASKYKPWVYLLPNASEIFLHYYNMSPYKDIYLYLVPYETDHNYIFPFSKVKYKSNIIIYGAGRLDKIYRKQIELTDYCCIVKWVDKNYMILSEENRLITSPSEINQNSFDYIVIAIAFEKPAAEIKKQLIMSGVAEQKIVWKPIKIS